eukprot:Awhi_evm1s1402
MIYEVTYDLFSLKGKITCSDDEGSFVIFNHVSSAEACIEAAIKRGNQFVNYIVSNGNCQVLSCDSQEYRWDITDDTDIYSFSKNNITSSQSINIIKNGDFEAHSDGSILYVYYAQNATITTEFDHWEGSKYAAVTKPYVWAESGSLASHHA